MTTFYFIRHGEKQKHVGDPALAPVGELQAKITGQHLTQFPIRALYASPLLRTKQTAQHIADALGLDVVEEAALLERMNWESPDQTFQEFMDEWEKATQNPEYQPKLGNSVKGTAERVHQLIHKLAEQHPDQHVILVTHGGTIRDFLTTYVPQDHHWLTQEKMEGILECSITQVVVHEGKLEVTCVNTVDHLK